MRIRTHYAGNAEASTLRKTLGCLLADELGIELRLVGSGKRQTFIRGEQQLSAWMSDNALVSWVVCDRPWEVEEQLIRSVDLPLNLEGNRSHLFHPELSRIRSAAVRRAKELPVVPNPGVAGGRAQPVDAAGRRFIARVVAPAGTIPGRVPLSRLVLMGDAATVDRRSTDDVRSTLIAALEALRDSGLRIGILATPAGFVDHKPGGSWDGTFGWLTVQRDFDELAEVATSVARQLMTPRVRELAQGTVENFVIGIDVWPCSDPEIHAEVACLYETATGRASPITGKSYPTPGQEDTLVRNSNESGHVIPIGEERVAVLVCHDLAAWSPRGNAVARGIRATTWRVLQDAVAGARPTLAIQLPHTVDKAATWQAAWNAFRRSCGPNLRGGSTAIRFLDKGYGRPTTEIGQSVLAGTVWGQPAVDVFVSGRGEAPFLTVETLDAPRLAAIRTTAKADTLHPAASGARGLPLAYLALEVFRGVEPTYPGGVKIGDLARELALAGQAIAGDNPRVTLSSALNNSQAHGVWARQPGAVWLPGGGLSKMAEGLAGRDLAESLHAYVSRKYPAGIFHYEEARVGLESTGVIVRGTGKVTRAALDSAPALFEQIPGRRGYWRWK